MVLLQTSHCDAVLLCQAIQKYSHSMCQVTEVTVCLVQPASYCKFTSFVLLGILCLVSFSPYMAIWQANGAFRLFACILVRHETLNDYTSELKLSNFLIHKDVYC